TLRDSANSPHLHSCPTRRSSDLARALQLLADEHVAAVQVLLLLLKREDLRLQPPHLLAQRLNLVLVVHARLRAEASNQLGFGLRSEEHTSELQSLRHLVCRLLLV